MTVIKTPRLALNLPNFAQAPWHDQMNDNFRALDAVFYTTLGLSRFRGKYLPSTNVEIGDRYFDETSGVIYEVVTTYVTSGPATTFAAERALFPTRWSSLELAAFAAADLAERFANEAEDVLVLPLRFSANHFAIKAAASAAASAASAATATAAAADYNTFALAQADLARLTALPPGAMIIADGLQYRRVTGSTEVFGLAGFGRAGGVTTDQLTFTVGTDYPTMQAALDSLHGIAVAGAGEINIQYAAGYTITGPTALTNRNFPGFRISSVDATVLLDAILFPLTADAFTFRDCDLPTWDVLIDGGRDPIARTGGRGRNGIMLYSSTFTYLPKRGFKNIGGFGSGEQVGYNAFFFGACTVRGESVIESGIRMGPIFSGAPRRGIDVTYGTAGVALAGIDVTYCGENNAIEPWEGGFFASRASIIHADFMRASGSVNGLRVARSLVSARDSNFSGIPGTAVWCFEGGTAITANGNYTGSGAAGKPVLQCGVSAERAQGQGTIIAENSIFDGAISTVARVFGGNGLIDITNSHGLLIRAEVAVCSSGRILVNKDDTAGWTVWASNPVTSALLASRDGVIDALGFSFDGGGVVDNTARTVSNGRISLENAACANVQVRHLVNENRGGTIQTLGATFDNGEAYPFVFTPPLREFDERSDAVALLPGISAMPEGTMLFAKGLGYERASASTAISDMAGYSPVGIRVSLRAWGILGDGTNELVRMQNAVNSGYPLSGEGMTVSVTGQLNMISGTSMHDVTLRQLAPGASLNVITLSAVSVNNLDLRRVKVNRNGDGTNGGLLNASGTNGALDTACGMSFDGGTGHLFEDLEVFGNDSGTGIRFINLDHSSRIIRPYVRDMLWSRTTATDDQVQGILIFQSTGLYIERAKAVRLTGILNAVASKLYTRGIVGGFLRQCTFESPYAEKCDQGIDMTGGDGNFDIVINEPLVVDGFTWGVKLANAARRCVVSNGRAIGCGVGFVASGNANLAAEFRSDRNKFVDCTAVNSGASGQAIVTIAGFRVLGDAEVAGATNTQFIRCHAVDAQAVKTMLFGFLNETAPSSTNQNVLIECTSVGHIIAIQSGFHEPYCRLALLAAQAITTAANTNVVWTAEDEDTGAMHDLVTTPERVIIRQAGYYNITASIEWSNLTAPATDRYIGFLINGVEVHFSSITNTFILNTYHATSFLTPMLQPDDYITVQVRHQRGSSLDVLVSGTKLTVNRVRG